MILRDQSQDDFPFLDVDPWEDARDDDLTGSYERDAVQLARVDPVTFLEYAFEWKCWPLHEEWQQHCTDFGRLVEFAPVDHGKTSQISFGRTTWELGRNPELRIMLLSSASLLACKTLGTIKTAILINPRVQKVFPWLKPERRSGRVRAWWDDAIIVERDDVTNKDFSIQAVGIAGSIIGSRIDLMIFDDILNAENTATENQRQKVIEWIKSTAINRLSARGRLWAIGTPWHEDDAMHWLEENDEYTAHRYDAEDDLWPELEIVAGKEVGWPEWRRRQRERELGSIEYGRAMRCRALTDLMTIFPISKFDKCVQLDGTIAFPQIYRSSDLLVITGVDLNVKKGQEHDSTVLFTAGLARNGLYQVLSIIAARMEIVEILRAIIDVHRRYGPMYFVVEDNAAQAYIKQFIDRSDEILDLLGAEDVNSVLRHVRVEPFTTGVNKYSPEYGVRAMVADLEGLKWRMPDTPEVAEWRKDMKKYSPSAKLGDYLAASWFTWTKLRGLARRSSITALTVGGNRNGPSKARGAIRPRIRTR